MLYAPERGCAFPGRFLLPTATDYRNRLSPSRAHAALTPRAESPSFCCDFNSARRRLATLSRGVRAIRLGSDPSQLGRVPPIPLTRPGVDLIALQMSTC
jgi:hypothetical protein